MKKKDGGIVRLLCQSEAGSSGLDECNKVWDHLNQNLLVRWCLLFLDSFNDSVLWNLVLQGMDAYDPVYWIMHFQCLHFIKQLWI